MELMIYNPCNSFVVQWLGTSTGKLSADTGYSGPANFWAKNVKLSWNVQVLINAFYKVDGKKIADVNLLLNMSLVF